MSTLIRRIEILGVQVDYCMRVRSGLLRIREESTGVLRQTIDREMLLLTNIAVRARTYRERATTLQMFTLGPLCKERSATQPCRGRICPVNEIRSAGDSNSEYFAGCGSLPRRLLLD